MILYPVQHCDRQTLLPLIKRYVEESAIIYTDGLGPYATLNDESYQHCVVNHKSNFKQVYKKRRSGKVVECHTNLMEGSWQHAK